jgi:F420-dependent oxidoreductase-like protein
VAMGKHRVRFGIQTGQQNVEWQAIVDLWRNGEAWGYDSLWAFDHFYPIFTDPTGPCLEGWTTLAALASTTRKARIGHLVTGNTYRNPCLLAKMAATVDHISNGRTVLGIGAGWFEAEHTSFGIRYGTVLERLEALDESCRIIKGMLAGEEVTLDGRHYKVDKAICRPLPVQQKVPLMIGGEGKKVLLRIVARHADMWNAFGTPERMAELIETIEQHCERERRNPDDIEKTIMMPLCYTTDPGRQELMVQILSATFGMSPEEARRRMMIGSRQECLDKIGDFVRVGVTHFIFMLMTPYFTDEIRSYAEEVIPAARAAF